MAIDTNILSALWSQEKVAAEVAKILGDTKVEVRACCCTRNFSPILGATEGLVAELVGITPQNLSVLSVHVRRRQAD